MSTINLRHLKIVDALIQHQSAVKAASALHISPSAISYSLNQLRKQTGKPLFKRTREGLRPHELAFELQKQYNEIARLNSVKNEYVIATYSLIEMLLAEYIHEENDTLLHFTTMESCDEERLRKLKHREVDIDIGGQLHEDRSIVCRRFTRSEFCLAVSQAHPRIKEEFTLDAWRENEHLLWQRGAGNITGMLDNVNHSLLTERKIAWTSPNLLTLAWHCAHSEHVMLMPAIFIPFLQKHFPVKAFTPPTELQMTFDCHLHYHLAMEEKIDALLLQNMFSAAITA
jgi:DNA-binding transcriptional LysR family regulator